MPLTLTSGPLPLTVALSTSSRPLPLRRLSVPCTSTIGAVLPATWPTVAPLIRPYGPFSGGAAARLPQFTVPEIVARLSWLNSASGSVTFRSIVTKAFVRPDGGGPGGGGPGTAAAPHPELWESVHWLPTGKIGTEGLGFSVISGGGGGPMISWPSPPPVIASNNARVSLTALSFAASSPPPECCGFEEESPWTIWAIWPGGMFVSAAGEIPVARNCCSVPTVTGGPTGWPVGVLIWIASICPRRM